MYTFFLTPNLHYCFSWKWDRNGPVFRDLQHFVGHHLHHCGHSCTNVGRISVDGLCLLRPKLQWLWSSKKGRLQCKRRYTQTHICTPMFYFYKENDSKTFEMAKLCKLAWLNNVDSGILQKDGKPALSC